MISPKCRKPARALSPGPVLLLCTLILLRIVLQSSLADRIFRLFPIGFNEELQQNVCGGFHRVGIVEAIASHNQTDIDELCDTVCEMDAGVLTEVR